VARRRRIRRRLTRRRRAAPRRRRGRRRGRGRRLLGRLRPRSGFAQMSNIAGALVFFSQLTQKDRDAGAYTGTMADKLRIFANNVTGRIIGFQPFSSHSNPAFTQTLNLDGAFNRFSGIGLAGLIYGMIPIKQLPHKGKVKTLSRRILTAGILGGIFDAPENDTRNRVLSQREAPRITARPMITAQVTTA